MTNCPNCGAAMEPVPSGLYFRCPHCGTYHFPEPVEADGITIVGSVPDAQACPVCGTGMARALIDGQHPVEFCATCRGLLLPRETFAHVTNTRRAWATTPPARPEPLNPRDLARVLSCPRCHRPFDTHPHYGPGNVVIDNCTGCDLVWLDHGELRQIVDAPGRDRGSRHVPRIDETWVREGPPRETVGDDSPLGNRTAADPFALLMDTLFGR